MHAHAREVGSIHIVQTVRHKPTMGWDQRNAKQKNCSTSSEVGCATSAAVISLQTLNLERCCGRHQWPTLLCMQRPEAGILLV